ncbi:MAG: hypothetical protein HOE79_05535 [Euryarchaeota archaeon]|jgi:hypothetical protein|nr:hypothetical protein [Euryarchaeota archaeon]
MSKVAMKKFLNDMTGRVVIVFVGIAIRVNASVMSSFTNDYKIENMIETNMELIGLIISTMAFLNIFVHYALAHMEEEEEELKI